MATTKNVIKIDLNAIKAIADQGLNRAYIFLGFGVNAARDSRLRTYDLGGNLQIIITPPPKSEAMLARAKKEFERWVIGHALRELIEAHTLFLDSIYDALLVRPFSFEVFSLPLPTLEA